MSEYKQIAAAGNQDTQNAFRASFSGADQSDIPQLQAWSDHLLNSVAQESLTGTPGNGSKSFIAAKSTHAGPAGVGWATGLAQTAGGAIANRLKGNESFVLLGTTPPVAAFPVLRTFNLAVLVPFDASPGSVGMQPVLAVKMFYAGAEPAVAFEANQGSEGVPNWQPLTSSPKGTAMAIAVGNAILPTGPDTVGGTANDGVIDPITRPGAGEIAAPEYWVRSL